MAVMADKAELIEMVEQKEVTIGQLSGETETIGSHTAVYVGTCYLLPWPHPLGEYIMLYQRQREALREKFKEKDNFIHQLISEKASIQVRGRPCD